MGKKHQWIATDRNKLKMAAQFKRMHVRMQPYPAMTPKPIPKKNWMLRLFLTLIAVAILYAIRWVVVIPSKDAVTAALTIPYALRTRHAVSLLGRFRVVTVRKINRA
jgi:hypothetical protein